VDLGVRVHRNRPLAELSPMAAIVIMTALHRAGLSTTRNIELSQPDFGSVAVDLVEMPPAATVPVDRRRSIP
jgi:hypothetical protein